MSLYEVITWLESIKKLDELIEAKRAEEDMLISVSSKSDFDGMPHSADISDVVGNNAVRLITVKSEKEALQMQKDDIIKTMQILPAVQFGVLHREYVRYMKREDVAADMGYCTVQIWRIKQEALKNLGIILENKNTKDVMKCN